jgi:hypothetical protein
MTPEETKEYFKAYYQANKEKMLKSSRERINLLDREELKNYRKNYYNANKEKFKEMYKKNNKAYRDRQKERKRMSNEDIKPTVSL